MAENVSVLIAFGAGLLSFLSPCVLPLIPSYLCVIGGAPLSGSLEKSETFRPRLAAGTVSFILGFSAVFIVLSVLFSATFILLGNVTRYISLISGAVVIVLGLNIIFGFLSFLNYEKRFHFAGRSGGIAAAFLTGAAFGAGWTPCVGPVLASILLMAAQSGGIPIAVLYLAFYSAGMGLPFLLASLFFNRFLKTSAKLRNHIPLIRRISGVLLVVMGILMVTGRYQALNALTSKWQNSLTGSAAPREETVDAELDDTAFGGGAFSGKPVSGSTGENAVPAAVIEAFRAAKLPVAAEGLEPVDFSLPLLDGTSRALSGLKGKAVFLNFWATWCGPCRMEMPSMEAVYRRLNGRGFEILAVNLGESANEVSVFIKENKLGFPVALDEKGTVSGYYGIQAIPTTYILDRRGLIVSRIVGAIDWDQPEIVAAFQLLLEN